MEIESQERKIGHAFFSPCQARRKGFSLCPDLTHGSDYENEYVRATFFSFGEAEQEWIDLGDLQYTGRIYKPDFDVNHYHFQDQNVCERCIGRRPPEPQEITPNEKRRHVLVKRKKLS